MPPEILQIMGGFRAIKPDRIHLYCGECGRRQSNMPRYDDPPNAVVAHIICDKHTGGKEDYCVYYDAQGIQIPWKEVGWDE